MIKTLKRISILLLTVVLLASSLSYSFADDEFVDAESSVIEDAIENNVKESDVTYTSSNDGDVSDNNVIESEDLLKVSVSMAKVEEDGKIEILDGIESTDKINASALKTSTALNSLYGANRVSTAVKVSQEGWPSGSDTVIIVNSSNTMVGIVATPYASMYNAPILLNNAYSLENVVSQELQRLNPNRVILIGDSNRLSKTVADKIKNITGAKVDRLYGSTSQEISVNIANKIAENKSVNTAFIVSGENGVADALSIASYAGSSKSPIIVVDKYSVGSGAYNYLNKYIYTAYYIGGTNSISDSVIKKISGVVGYAGYSNRLSGRDRHETNVKVVNKFYPNTNLSNVIVTKSDNQGLIDTVPAGPFSAKKYSPIILVGKTKISSYTRGLLNARTTNNLIQIGGGFSSSISNEVKLLLSSIISNSTNPGISPGIKGKTIVIDAGHGGKDPGAIGIRNTVEKEWTLITARACADYLRKSGANVIMTRDSDTYPTLPDRVKISNNNNAVFFCSIHYNKGGNIINSSTGEMDANGVEVFKGEGTAANNAAKNVLNSILSGFNLKNRGVKDGTHLYVIGNTDAPAILVEGGFLSSSKDVNILNSEAALKKMGELIAKGIVESFK